VISRGKRKAKEERVDNYHPIFTEYGKKRGKGLSKYPNILRFNKGRRR